MSYFFPLVIAGRQRVIKYYVILWKIKCNISLKK